MISLLYVDDEPDLREIVKLFLERKGQFHVETASSGIEALEVLRTSNYDAIISDYSMPGMDGIELLKSVRAEYGDIPFILFTGRGREEVVIAAINNGADFYIQKGGDPKAQFAELQHKIRKSIERRQALDAAKDSEQRLSDIINFLPDATFVIDRSGHVIAWNRAIEEMTGVAAEDMVGKGDYEYAIPFYGRRRPILIDLIYEPERVIAKNYEHIIREKDVLIADTTLPRPQGRSVTLMGKASPLYNRQGEIVGAIESIRDLTDRKLAEEELKAVCEQLTASQEELQGQYRTLAENEQAIRESEARFRELAELLPQIIFEMDTRFRLTFVNRQTYTALGYSPEDIAQGVNGLSLIAPEDQIRVRENIRKLITGEPFAQREYSILRKDGSRFLGLIYANPIRRDETLTGFRGVVIDITDRVKADEALCKSEEKYRLLVEVNRDIVYSLDPDGTILYISPQTLNQIGYHPDELEGHNFLEFIHPDDSEILVRHMQEHFNSDAPFSSDQFRVLRKDGTYRWYEDKSIYTTNSQGRPVITGTIADITDRKAAEDELRKSELRLKYMLGFYEMAGRSESELLNYAVEGAGVVTGSPLGYLAFLNEDESELTMYAWSSTAMKECSMREKPVVYRTENTGLWGEAVRRRRTVITNDYQADNPAKKGYPKGHPDIVRHMNIPVMDADRIMIVSGVANKPTEYTKDDARELTILMQGLWQVIKRKRAEEAQQDSEARFRLLIESSPVPIIVARDGILIYCNTAFCNIEGTEDPTVLQGRDLLSFVAPECREKVAGYIRVREAGEPAPRHYQAIGMRIDGTRFPYEISVAVIPLSDGPATMAFLNDITDRRRTEEELKAAYEQLAASEEELRGQFDELVVSEQRIRDSEEKYRTLIEHSRDGFFIIQEGRLVFYNRGAFNSLTGYSEQELVGRTLSELVAPEDFGRLMQQLQDRQQGKPVPDTLEFHLLHKDGKTRTLVRSHASMGLYQGTRALMGSLTDITEDRRRQNALRESEERYRNFFANITEGVFRIDFPEPVPTSQLRDRLASDIHDHAVFGEVNAAFAAMYGMDPEDMIGRPVREIIPNYGGKMADILMRPEESTIELEEKEFTPTGEQVYMVDRYFSAVEDGFLNRIWGVKRNITKRKKAEEARAASERQLRLITENMVDQICQIDSKRRILYASPSVERLMGYRAEDLVGHPVTEYVHPDDTGRIIREIRSAIDQRLASVRLEYRFLHREGDYRWFESETRILYDAEGEFSGAIFTSREISDRKTMEEALRENEELFRRVIEGAPEAIYIGVDWKFVYLNPAAVRLFGASSSDELVGTPFIDLIHPDYHDIMRNRVHQLYDERTPVQVLEEVYKKLDGSIFDVEVSSVPFTYQGKNGALVFIRDISDRKRAEEALKASEMQFRSVIENIQEGFIRTDSRGCIVMASPSTAHMFGYDSVDDMIGTPISKHYSAPESRQGVLDQLGKIGHVSDYEIRFRRKNGSVFLGSLNAHRLDEEQEGCFGTEGIIRDITERKQMETAILEANRKLNLLNSITRHDVKNQLMMLQGFAQIALMKKTDPEVTDYLSRIESAARIISDQIEFTRTYQELGVHSPEWFRIDELVEKTAVEYVKFLNTCRRYQVFADPMFERVFFNLFDNALRHGERVTEITIRCAHMPEGLLLTVEDNGIGIPEEAKEKIFEEGYGSHTGFGLFLVREILAITGISIRETGIYGEGARFEIHVPNEACRYLREEDR